MDDFLTIYKQDYVKHLIKRTPAYCPEPDYPNGVVQGPMTEYLHPADEWDRYPQPPTDHEPLGKFLRRVKRNIPFKKDAQDVPDMECICVKGFDSEAKELEAFMKNQKKKLNRTVYQSEICHIGEKYGITLQEDKHKITLPKDWVFPQTTYGASYRIPSFRDVAKPFTATKDNLKVNEIEIKVRKLTTGESEYSGKIGKLGETIIENKVHGEMTSFAKSLNCFEILQRKPRTLLM